jgi:prepilin-type N-terminal cleavage/methylation domain-containing protein/prepilin-type processing-associated H-X9-DG protein
MSIQAFGLHNLRAKRLSGFTLVEILTVVAIIAILIAISFPVYQSVLAHARSVVCLGNLRQIGTGILLYAQDNNGRFPPLMSPGSTEGTWWTTYHSWDYTIKPYLGLPPDQPSQIFRCPSDPRPYDLGNGNYARTYTINGYYSDPPDCPPGFGLISSDTSAGLPTPVRSIMQITHGSECIMASEWCTDTSGNPIANYQDQGPYGAVTSGWVWQPQVPILPGGSYIHQALINYVFVDGHAAALSLSQVSPDGIPAHSLWQATAP